MAEVVKQPATDRPPPHFPDDVLIEIFLRLPVRSLLLFRSVSKHWLSLIQNPHFITLHFNRPMNNYNDHNPMLVATAERLDSNSQSRNSKVVLTFLSDDDTLPYQDNVALEVLSMASRSVDEVIFHLLGPCNGVFCVTDTFDIVLFNPATRRYRKVPRSPFSVKSRGCHDMSDLSLFDFVGFGFDTVSKDYKVVTFDGTVQQMTDDDHSSDYVDEDDIYDDYEGNNVDIQINGYSDEMDVSDDDVDIEDNHDDDGEVDGDRCKVGVFSLSTNCWKELKCDMPGGHMRTIYRNSFYFNSAVHWRGGDDCNYCSILVFDLSKEVFKRFELPNIPIGDHVYLSVLTGSLGIIVHKDLKSLSLSGEFELSVMLEYGVNESWTKLYNITIDVGIDWPFWFSNGEFLLQNEDGKLVSYNQITKTIKEFQFHGDLEYMYAFRYKESLVSLR